MNEEETVTFDDLIEEMNKVKDEPPKQLKRMEKAEKPVIPPKPLWKRPLNTNLKLLFSRISKELMFDAKKVLFSIIKGFSALDMMRSVGSRAKQWVKDKWDAGIQKAKDVLIPKDKIDFILNILMLIGAIVLAWRAVDFFGELVTRIKESFSKAYGKLSQETKEVLGNVVPQGVKDFIGKVFASVKEIIGPFGQAFKEAVDEVVAGYHAIVSLFTVDNFYEYIVNPISKVLSISEFVGIIWDAFWAAVGGFDMEDVMSMIGLKKPGAKKEKEQKSGYYKTKEDVIRLVREGKSGQAKELVEKAKKTAAEDFTKALARYTETSGYGEFSNPEFLKLSTVHKGYDMSTEVQEQIQKGIMKGNIGHIEISSAEKFESVAHAVGASSISYDQVNRQERKANKVIDILNTSLADGNVVSWEEFTRKMGDDPKKLTREKSSQLLTLYDSYTQMVKKNQLGKDVAGRKGKFNEHLYKVQLAQQHKQLVINSDINAYYGEFNMGEGADQVLEDFALKKLSLKSAVAGAIEMFLGNNPNEHLKGEKITTSFKKDEWDKVPQVLERRLKLAINETLSNVDFGSVLKGYMVMNVVAKAKNEGSSTPMVNYFTLSRPEGFDELATACYQQEMLEVELEKEMDRQYQLISQMAEVLASNK